MAARQTARLITGAAFIALLVAMGAGCGSGSGASLEGTSWRLTSWSASGQDPVNFTITAAFKDGHIGGTSAVNQYGGPYKAGGDVAFSVGDLASTMMAGPEADMRAEQTYTKLLPAMTCWHVDGDTLTLSGGGKLVYTRTVASPSP